MQTAPFPKKLKIVVNSNNFHPYNLSLIDFIHTAPSLHRSWLELRYFIMQDSEIGWGEREIRFDELRSFIMYEPLVVRVNNTTDNRKLKFFRHTLFGDKSPLSPQINKDNVPYSKLKDEEIPSLLEWNLADSKEDFILDTTTVIDLEVSTKDAFFIEFDITVSSKNLVRESLTRILEHQNNHSVKNKL